MTLLISDYMRKLNLELHDRADYGGGGYRHAARIDDLARRINAKSILDYGAGKGTLKTALVKLKWPPKAVHEYDPAIPGKDRLPDKRWDLVVCTDVMEHIEPDCLDDVLASIARVTKQVGYFAIANRPASKQLGNGQNTHLIVEDGMWWFDKLRGSGFRVVYYNEQLRSDGSPHSVVLHTVTL